VDVRKLWTRNDVTIITKRSDGGQSTVVVPHNLGVVPFIRKEEVDGFGLDANHWFDDVVDISDAILNNESEAQMNTIKQMFGLLVVPESFASNTKAITEEAGEDEEAPTSVAGVISRSAAIIESIEDKGISRYISPGGAENATIRAENQALIRMLFEVVGLAVSKDTKMVESAEAKAWDFQNVEQYMATRADVLEQCEYQAWELMSKWNPAIPIPTISYNRNFAVIDLKESIASLLELSGFNQDSDEYQREINRTAVVLLNSLRQLSQENQNALDKEIAASNPATDAKKAMFEAAKLANADNGQE
jgi:hypothetical protein